MRSALRPASAHLAAGRHSRSCRADRVRSSLSPGSRIVVRSILRSSRQEVYFDKRAAWEAGDADAGARRQTARRKVALIDPVHRRVIALEMDEIDAREHDPVERATAAGEDEFQIVDEPAGLGLDAVRQGRAIVGGIGRHLAGDEEPALACGGMAERRDRRRRAGDHQKFDHHRLPNYAAANCSRKTWMPGTRPGKGWVTQAALRRQPSTMSRNAAMPMR